MAEKKIKSVFLSYAEPDGGIAKLIHDDLRRSGVDVWGFEANGQAGVDFVNEFTSQLQSRRAFCLLDSRHARKSDWVRMECELALACRQKMPAFDFLPCLIRTFEKDSGWCRDELFIGQNRLSYLDLTQYDTGIRKLCRHLGTVYFPYSDVQRDCDFQAEIRHLGLDRAHLEELEQIYEGYRRTRGDRPQAACGWLNELIDRLDASGADTVISPRLALAVLHSEADRHQEAFQVFRHLSGTQPGDPRIWAGLAGARFFMGDYRGAIKDYRQSERLVRKYGDPEDRLHLVELVHNIALAQLELGNHMAAWKELKRLSENAVQNPEIAELKGRICLKRGSAVEAKQYFETAQTLFRDKGAKPPLQLLSDLADTYRQLGRKQDEERCISACLSELDLEPEVLRRLARHSLQGLKFHTVIDWLTQAIEKAPHSIVYRSELASILFHSGDIDAAKVQAGECHELKAATAREHYYLGLAYHILNSPEVAKFERDKADGDSVVAGWPEYGDLFV